jgi:hypothetical protein
VRINEVRQEEIFIRQDDPGKKGLEEKEQDKKLKISRRSRGRKKLMCSPHHIICPNCTVKRCRDDELPVAAKLYTRDA